MSSSRVGARFKIKIYWVVAQVFFKVLVLTENGS